MAFCPPLAVRGHTILSELKSYSSAMQEIERLYGATPPSPEAAMFRLHDQSVAESIHLISDLQSYAERQAQNAMAIFKQVNLAGPIGAQRMTATTNSQILHALTQLIKINGQILKLQSEFLAQANKQGKDSVNHFNQLNKELSGMVGVSSSECPTAEVLKKLFDWSKKHLI